MDIDDVSHISQWVQQLEQGRAVLDAAEKHKGERPTKWKSRGQLVNEFTMQHMAAGAMKTMNMSMVSQSWIADPYPPSVAPLEILKKLFIKDMRLETQHRGCYTVLRVATPPSTRTAIMAIVEDEKADGVLLSLYQQESESDRSGNKVMEFNRVCIVKEPYFKGTSDGGYGVRVDHLSDIVWLSSEDERVPFEWRPQITELEKTTEDLKEEGNAAFKTGNFEAAIQSYTSALVSSSTIEMSRTLKLNRSMANLKLRRYDEALTDATDDSQQSEKGLYRAAIALYELGRFQESHQAFGTLLSRYPTSDTAKKEMIRTTQRLKEQQHGDYNFTSMYQAAKKNPPCLDHATFASNVEVRASEGRGRGLFTTKDMVAGEILLCEKAFAYCSEKHSKISILMHTRTKRAILGTQADLITTIANKMFRNPSLGAAFTSLHHGDYESVDQSEVDGIPIVDTFLIDRIISLNSFGCPRTSLENHFSDPAPEQKNRSESHHTSAIFIKASFINHSCYGNANRSFIGDMQVVRATRNIPARSEIFFMYVRPGSQDSWDKRQERFKSWKFECTCAICQESKKVKKNVFKNRLGLLKDLDAALDTQTDVNLEKVDRIMAAIEKSYTAPASEVPRLALWAPYLLLSRNYCMNNQQDKVIETAWKALASFGFKIKREDPQSLKSPFEIEQWGLIDDHLIQTWVLMWTAYAQVAPHLCKKAEEYARITYKICIGEDDTFDEKYGKLAFEAMFEGLDLGKAFQSMHL